MSKLWRYATIMTASLIVLAGALFLPKPVAADGIIIIDPPLPVPPPDWSQWLTIRYHHVNVTIEGQIAVTEVDQVFRNDARISVEGTYVFPLPSGAVVEDFLMWVDDQPLESQILPADEARKIYESYVQRNQDPALLEYVGRDTVQARVFPIPPGEERRIRLRYTQILPLEETLLHYRYPLNTERFSAKPLEEVKVTLTVVQSTDLGVLYSPTHQDQVTITREDSRKATMTYEAENLLPEKDFEVYIGLREGDVGAAVLSYNPSNEDGFFLLMLTPPIHDIETQIMPRDLVFVLDTSGSMDGEKLEQAQAGLRYVLSHLNAKDRFNIIAFSSQVRTYAPALVSADEADAASDWVDRLEALGGTNIQLALTEALAQIEEDRHTVLIFLTDGLPTEGVVDEEVLLGLLEDALTEDVRVFPLGVGYDVNVLLLDQMAETYRGRPTYIEPDERIDQKISTFFERMQSPLLTDIMLSFETAGNTGIEVYDLAPSPLPDLYAGTQLIVTGRYAGSGGSQVLALTGHVYDRDVIYKYDIELEDHDGTVFIPRLWAARKIGHLLTQIRLHGETSEWVESVVALSLKYGIITPYTSFLIEEPEETLSQQGRQNAGEAMKEELAAAPTAVSGVQAVDDAQLRQSLDEAEAPPSGGIYTAPQLPDVDPGSAPGEVIERMVRYVAAKTFICTPERCIDTLFIPDVMEIYDVPLGSELYDRLVIPGSDWNAYLALPLGTVIVYDTTTAYRLALNGAETSTQTETATPEAPTATPPPQTIAATQEDDESPRETTGTCAASYLLLLPVAAVILKKAWYTRSSVPSSGQGEAPSSFCSRWR